MKNRKATFRGGFPYVPISLRLLFRPPAAAQERAIIHWGEVAPVKLRLANWLLSLFAPRLEPVYDRASKRLVEYHEISNILALDGEYQNVHITCTYPSDS